MKFCEPKEWPVGARSGQLDMTFVAFSIVLLRIGDLHQGHVRQCEAGGKDTIKRDGSAFMQRRMVADGALLKGDLQAGPAVI